MSKKFSYLHTFLLGFGFFGICIVWSVYNSFVPIFLKELGLASAIVGFIMTIDNIFAVTIQPYVGFLSDKTETRWGKRKPYIILSAPIVAIALSLIPMSNVFLLMLAFIVVMNIAMAVHRTPTIALMPDITPSEYLSKANGIINFMGGVGALLAFFIGGVLYDMHRTFPFIFAAVLLLLGSIIIVLVIKEPKTVVKSSGKGAFEDLITTVKEAFRSEEPSTRGILLAIFAWFFGYNAIETFFTSYGKWFLNIKESQATFMLGYLALVFILTSIPSGFIASKIGRRRTIKIGIIGLIVLLSLPVFLRSPLILSVIMALTGFFWALINVNSLPIVADLAPEEKIGGYTGLYYFFQMTAAILSPPFTGLLIDVFDYRVIFVVAVVSMIVAFYFMSWVKKEKR